MKQIIKDAVKDKFIVTFEKQTHVTCKTIDAGIFCYADSQVEAYEILAKHLAKPVNWNINYATVYRVHPIEEYIDECFKEYEE